MLGIIKNDFLKLYNFFSNSKCVEILLIMIWPKNLSVNQIAEDSFMRNIFWIEKLAILCTDRHRFYMGTDLSPLYMTESLYRIFKVAVDCQNAISDVKNNLEWKIIKTFQTNKKCCTFSLSWLDKLCMLNL